LRSVTAQVQNRYVPRRRSLRLCCPPAQPSSYDLGQPAFCNQTTLWNSQPLSPSWHARPLTSAGHSLLLTCSAVLFRLKAFRHDSVSDSSLSCFFNVSTTLACCFSFPHCLLLQLPISQQRPLAGQPLRHHSIMAILNALDQLHHLQFRLQSVCDLCTMSNSCVCLLFHIAVILIIHAVLLINLILILVFSILAVFSAADCPFRQDTYRRMASVLDSTVT
jgi:hypothetical protein